MNNNTFNFKLIDTISYLSKDKKNMCKIVAYCSYGFVVNFYTSIEKANEIKEKAKNKNNDITDFVYVFYDNNKQRFAYIINNK